MASSNPPRENLIRALRPGIEIRDTNGDDPDADSGPVMTGHFAVFDEWTEIDSIWEGHFMERVAPGAFKKTFRENRDQIKVTLNHGRDPQLGDKPLGTIDDLREDELGAAYEVPLFDGIPDLVMAGLRAGTYGSSFRFRVIREDFNHDAEASDDNPHALPERTLKEIQVFEFGPVTFPAYANATAGVRSLTDAFLFDELARDPERARKLLTIDPDDIAPVRDDPAPPTEDAAATAAPPPSGAARSTQHIYGATRGEEKKPWHL